MVAPAFWSPSSKAKAGSATTSVAGPRTDTDDRRWPLEDGSLIFMGTSRPPLGTGFDEETSYVLDLLVVQRFERHPEVRPQPSARVPGDGSAHVQADLRFGRAAVQDDGGG